MMIRFRDATAEDAEALFALWKAAVDATHGFLAPEHKALIEALVREQFLPNADLLIAVDPGDRPLAFLAMAGEKIEALFVDPDHHGRGIGRALLERGGQDRPILQVDVNEQNAGATAFYRRLGFREIGRSESDALGLPYPLLHLERRTTD